jgi:predicted nucleic acid-binding protein
MSQKRVYLDVCILCRPFDDQAQARIHLETNALELILTHIRESALEFIVSPTHNAEINSIQNSEERQHLFLLLNELGTTPKWNLQAIRQRAETLSNAGMGVADAAHVAFAEYAGADFVTVDDRLLKQCQRLGLKMWSGSPLAYCDKESFK